MYSVESYVRVFDVVLTFARKLLPCLGGRVCNVAITEGGGEVYGCVKGKARGGSAGRKRQTRLDNLIA